MAEHDNWAHSRQDETGQVHPHELVLHLAAVSASACVFAARFGAPWALLAGLWHDLGKYRPGFQTYIRQTSEAHIEDRVPDAHKTHSAAGALWASRLLEERFGAQGRAMSRVLQYVIAGHHAGLDNWDGALAARLAESRSMIEFDDAMKAQPPATVLQPDLSMLELKSIPLGSERKDIPGRYALWVRMLFSALVDADFLDTEMFFDPSRSAARQPAVRLDAMKDVLDAHLAYLSAHALETPVNRLRSEVLRQCRAKASLPPGAFTLTVPTGGGKTLASLAFALHHVVHHGKRRVIYAIPYTSIIEQTAEVFRHVFASFGADAVIEHHSNADAAPERETSRSRLACENWDAPLIVTTNVQFFESLFACRTSRCRKLHRIADSVVILDEAQLLPVEFLQPVVDVLQLLVREYGVTLLLCTATQPELGPSFGTDRNRGLQRGFDRGRVTEIVDDVASLHAALRRVRVHLPADLEAPRSWPDLADEISSHDAVLAIVNRRADARELFRQVQRRAPNGCWHLSALMCAQHRSDVLFAIKASLCDRNETLALGDRSPRPVKVVSTQLIEAGVDLDLPVVYRAIAGLDSIAQAAGRCNREGRLADLGDVHVFVPPSQPPPGLLRQARDVCKTLWHDRPDDPFDIGLFQRFFKKLYHDAPSLDAKGVCDALRLDLDVKSASLAVRFRDAADAFKLIDDEDSATVIVRYRSARVEDDIDGLIVRLTHNGPDRWLMRKLQRYGVSIYKHQAGRLVASRDIEEVASCPGLYVQIAGVERFYDAVFGANVDSAPGDPAAFVT